MLPWSVTEASIHGKPWRVAVTSDEEFRMHSQVGSEIHFPDRGWTAIYGSHYYGLDHFYRYITYHSGMRGFSRAVAKGNKIPGRALSIGMPKAESTEESDDIANPAGKIDVRGGAAVGGKCVGVLSIQAAHEIPKRDSGCLTSQNKDVDADQAITVAHTVKIDICPPNHGAGGTEYINTGCSGNHLITQITMP